MGRAGTSDTIDDLLELLLDLYGDAPQLLVIHHAHGHGRQDGGDEGLTLMLVNDDVAGQQQPDVFLRL